MTMPWEDYKSTQPAAGPWLDYQAASNAPESQAWHNILPNDPNKTYGDILPISKDKTTGKVELAAPNMIRSPIHGIGDLYQQAEGESGAINNGGYSSETPIKEMTPDALNAVMSIAPLAQLRFANSPEVAGNAVNDIPSKLGKFLESDSSAPSDFTKKPNFTNGDYQKAIGNTVAEAQASRKPFYDFMNESAQGHSIEAEPILNNAKALLSENETNPFQQAAVTRLKKFVDQYNGTDSIPLADAVEFKQDINSIFKPNAYDQGKNSAYFQLGNKLGSAIDKAAESNPIFAKARALADQNHVDNVAMAFKNNELLGKIWQPEDQAAYESLRSGRASYLPDETMLRQRQMISSIKTPEQLDAVTRLMPPDMASIFRQEVLKNMRSGNWNYRADQLGNVLGDPFKAPKHVFNVIKGQPYTSDEKTLLRAAKSESPHLSTQKLAEQLLKLKSDSKEPPRLALPAPSMTTDRYGVTHYGNPPPIPDERGSPDSRSPFTPNPSDMRKAASKTSPVFDAQEAEKQAQIDQMFNQQSPTIKQLIADSIQRTKDADLPLGELGKKLAEILAKGGGK